MPAPKAGTMDRRVARTRKTLQHSLLALMLKKGYDAITVEEICAEADVGRSTFYAHFTGKDDLKRSGLDTHLRKMLLERQRQATEGAANNERFSFALPFLEHARDHLDLYRALVSKGGAQTTIRMIRQIVTEQVRRELSETARDKSPHAFPREVVVQFIAGAFMSLLTWWLDSGTKLPAQRVDAIFRHLATEGAPQGHGRKTSR